MKCNRKYVGILYAIVINIVFLIIAYGCRPLFDGVAWYLFSSAQRLIFGCVAVGIFCKLYNRNMGQVFTLKNSKTALVAGSGFLIYFVYYVITLGLGIEKIVGLTLPLIISRLFLQQITTGLYEEIVCRGLVLEGYYEQEKRTWKKRLFYAACSFLIFGASHLIGGNLYTFVFTGMIGFSFATIYLKSHNILIPMLLHFVYDIFANMSNYVSFNTSVLFRSINSVFDIVVAFMFVISFVALVKGDKR